MMGSDDLEVFFDAEDFATPWLRQRPGVGDVLVHGILGEESQDGLQGRLVSTNRELLLPTTADVRTGDVLVLQVDMPALGLQQGKRFRVEGPVERLSDGAQMVAFLTDAGGVA
jgi:hypothetical protein